MTERHLDCPGTGMSKADELQQRTAAFADLSIEFVTGLPETQVVRRISLQFLDASTSVGANYRAARRAKSHADFVSFGNDAMIRCAMRRSIIRSSFIRSSMI
jgi:four helix bundle protein